MTKRKNSKPLDSQIGLALDISGTASTTLRDAARVSQVPYFHEAAGLVLGIIDIIQGTRDNKDAFGRLAVDAFELVYALLHIDQKNIPKDLLDNTRELSVTLASVDKFARKYMSRNALHRAVRRKSDVGKIQEYRDRMRQSLDLFHIKSNLSLHENIARMSSQQEELLKGSREGKLGQVEIREMGREDAEPATVAREKLEDEQREKAERSEELSGKGHEQLEEKQTERVKLEMGRLQSQRLARVGVDRGAFTERREGQSRTSTQEPKPELMETEALPPSPMTNQNQSHQSQRSPNDHNNLRPQGHPTISAVQNTPNGDINITNTKSGNTNCNNITGSHNDSSVRIRTGVLGRRRR